MKKALIILFCLGLTALSALAEAGGPAVFDEGALHASLLECRESEGGFALLFSFENGGDADAVLIAFDPKIDGETAYFSDGWGTEILEIPAGGALRETLEILPETEGGACGSVSLRWILDGTVSSPVVIGMSEDGTAVTGASLAAGLAEPQLLEQAVACPEDPEAYAREVTDRLSEDELAMLDRGDLAVFIRESGPDGPCFTQLARAAIEVDGEGAVTARYSGMALVLDGAPDFLIELDERSGPERLAGTLRARPGFAPGSEAGSGTLSLTGNAVYYAGLDFEIERGADGCRISRFSVDSPELVQKCTSMPFSLFESVQTSCDRWLVEREEQELRLSRTDSLTARWSLSGPMRLSLVPASGLGDIVMCFEYFFTDGSDAVRLPIDYQN
ncbi:MAG: hypothetical protein IJH78_00510 [Clostridia bacterium]|nr:hypothetical protein [Clostridia bacterium]